MRTHRIAVLASASGSNAERLYEYFLHDTQNEISLVITNNPSAGVIQRCNRLKLDCHVLQNGQLTSEELNPLLKQYGITHVVLAGYLKLIPKWLIASFQDKIVNIHPALLPSYGGKGMYGMHVHESVVQNLESFTGITIHLVSEEYDKGRILLQKTIKITHPITSEQVAEHIHTLEYRYFPPLVEAWVQNS
jgi:phosphoribosylglycinamide formyltransferase-1